MVPVGDIAEALELLTLDIDEILRENVAGVAELGDEAGMIGAANL